MVLGKSEKYLKFEYARDEIRKKNFKSRKEFLKYINDNNISNIPKHPKYVYDEWISLYDWLGIVKKSNKNQVNVNYKEAKIIIHKLLKNSELHIDSKSKWLSFYEDNLELLINIPKHPQIKYKNSGWESWSEWLNTSSKSDKVQYTLDEVKKLIVENEIDTRDKYYLLCKVKNLPTNPISKFNLNKWCDILCKKKRVKNKYLPYYEAKEIINNMGLKSQKEWYCLSKNKKIPINIPRTPNSYYDEWVSWNDWLGHNVTTNKKFISYKKAKKYLSDKGITSLQEYYDYLINNQIDFLPLSPSTYYGKDYKSINDLLSNSDINISYGEKKIIKYLNNKNITYKHQYKFKNCKHINQLIFDFFLPKENICIEFDGRQHFEPIDFFGGEESFKLLKVRDNIKNNFCIENNIKLCRISYEDINIIDKLLNRIFT